MPAGAFRRHAQCSAQTQPVTVRRRCALSPLAARKLQRVCRFGAQSTHGCCQRPTSVHFALHDQRTTTGTHTQPHTHSLAHFMILWKLLWPFVAVGPIRCFGTSVTPPSIPSSSSPPPSGTDHGSPHTLLSLCALLLCARRFPRWFVAVLHCASDTARGLTEPHVATNDA
jgi:hypothetical protein